MKTAKEMFKELGYSMICYHVDGNLNEILFHNNGNMIKFLVNQMNYYVYDDYLDDRVNVAKPVYSKLHQAITQQMKELGWIE